jgi:hypothetical protein
MKIAWGLPGDYLEILESGSEIGVFISWEGMPER